MKKIVLLAFVLALLSTAVVVTFIKPAIAGGTIYIRPNGAVEGTDKIQRDGDVYIFTDNIYNEIVVEKDNIVIEGAGYTLQGTGVWHFKGIDLSGRSNVTIKDMEIKAFDWGIYLSYSSNNTVSGNNITNNYYGFGFGDSSNNTVTGNNITNNGIGIWLLLSSNNRFYHNNFINNTQQVYIDVPSYANFWDDGAGKGNYWSDYEEKYPNATELDDSGIWDTPYVIDENNQDNYPIVAEFPTWTSMLLILIVLTFAIAIYKRRLPKTPIN